MLVKRAEVVERMAKVQPVQTPLFALEIDAGPIYELLEGASPAGADGAT